MPVSMQPLPAAQLNPDQHVPIHVVATLVGFGKTTILAREKRGDFPRGTRFGPRCKRWRVGDVTRWVEEQRQREIAAAPQPSALRRVA